MSPKRDDLVGERWIVQFEISCYEDDLSIGEMRRMTKDVAEDDLKGLKGSSFLHQVCRNKNVTLEIVQYLLDFYPEAINTNIDGEEILGIDYVESAYPLHLACYNEDCPNEVIDLLLRKETRHQLTRICRVHEDWGGYCDDNGGTPLHYYLSRTSNVDFNIVKRLVANTDALLLADDTTKCTPVHILLHNTSIGNMFDVLQYLVELNPSSLRKKDKYDENPFHCACRNQGITVETIKFLLNYGVDVLYERNEYGDMPLQILCSCESYQTYQMDDEVAMDILKLLLTARPNLARIRTDDDDGDANLPLHVAATNKSSGFCKLLVDAYPESVETINGHGSLPFHFACYDGRPDTVEFLYGLHPESLHIRNGRGWLPIHLACDRIKESTSKTIKFLVHHDPECLSKPVSSTHRGDQYTQGNGALPFHIACTPLDKFNVTELIYDLYPEAILMQNERRQLPIDVIREKLGHISRSRVHFQDDIDYEERMRGLIPFLYAQMSYATKAQNETVMRRRDFMGLLPLHQAIRSRAPLGSIKLLIKGNPDAINVPDGYGVVPLDLACQFSTVEVAKYLEELIGNDRLNACDVNKNFPLHHACRGGNCKVIEYLLERPMSSASVSERNVDDMLPVHLFCEFVKGRWCEGETPEYTETIWRLLTAYPETVLNS